MLTPVPAVDLATVPLDDRRAVALVEYAPFVDTWFAYAIDDDGFKLGAGVAGPSADVAVERLIADVALRPALGEAPTPLLSLHERIWNDHARRFGVLRVEE